jgi:formate dehydrogenase maturation protein FdhE
MIPSGLIYLILDEIANSNTLFQRIIQEFKDDTSRSVEAHLEYLKSLRRAGNLNAASKLATALLEKVDSNEQVPTTLWASTQIELAKLQSQCNQLEVSV